MKILLIVLLVNSFNVFLVLNIKLAQKMLLTKIMSFKLNITILIRD